MSASNHSPRRRFLKRAAAVGGALAAGSAGAIAATPSPSIGSRAGVREGAAKPPARTIPYVDKGQFL